MAKGDVEVELKMVTTGTWACSECSNINIEQREPEMAELLNCAYCGAQHRVTKKTMLRENYRG